MPPPILQRRVRIWARYRVWSGQGQDGCCFSYHFHCTHPAPTPYPAARSPPPHRPPRPPPLSPSLATVATQTVHHPHDPPPHTVPIILQRRHHTTSHAHGVHVLSHRRSPTVVQLRTPPASIQYSTRLASPCERVDQRCVPASNLGASSPNVQFSRTPVEAWAQAACGLQIALFCTSLSLHHWVRR
jgi:hypothetical protein